MVEFTLIQQFLRALPRDEYINVQIVPEPEGVMAAEFQTVLAEATWQRLGGRSCFIKAIKVADEGASEQTHRVIGIERLKRIKDRADAAISQGVPVVVVFHVGFIGEGMFFIQCMEKITPLDKVVLDKDGFILLASRMLKELSPGVNKGWHHYDLCLKNLGVTVDGSLVFIDIDSLYESCDGEIHISMPIGKEWRLPRSMIRRIHSEFILKDLRITQETALAKQQFDLVLAAAELTLQEPVPGGDFTADDWLPFWLESAEDRALVDFWLPILNRGLNEPESLVLDEIAAELLVINHVSVSKTNSMIGLRLSVDTDQLPEMGKLMRNDLLDKRGLIRYLQGLRQHLEMNPKNLKMWHELRMLTIGYLRDLDIAAVEVDRALEHFPTDAALLECKEVLKIWKQE